MDATEFKKCFMAWVESIRTATAGEVIPIDGKTMRRSHDRSHGQGAIHLVSAYPARNRLTLGQVKVDEKSNEITAIPELLRLLYVKGCIITIDAMGTQKEIVELIGEQEADYVLALKDDQPNLRAEVEGIVEAELAQRKKEENRETPRSVEAADFVETIDQGHGRRETRRVYSLPAPEFLRDKEAWRDLNSLIMVEARREVNDQVSTERRYDIASLAPDAGLAAEVVRTHWAIENSLHRVLDVAFREDELRVRAGNAFVRSPQKLKPARSLMVVQGDPHHQEVIAAAVRGHDAVLSAIGPSPREALLQQSTLLTDCARATVEAMTAGGVSRLAMVSAAVLFPGKGLYFGFFRWLLKYHASD